MRTIIEIEGVTGEAKEAAILTAELTADETMKLKIGYQDITISTDAFNELNNMLAYMQGEMS